MKSRHANWQVVASGILILVVWFAALPVYTQTGQDGKGIGIKVVSELPSKEKRWALIVGIDEYKNDVSTLKGAVNDAKALKNVLVNYAGFPESQIILLTTDSAEQDKRPTRENILRALRDLHNRVDEDGLLLFSFSGHGISIGDQAFLIPSNGSFTKNLSLLEDFSIDVSRIKRAIQEIKVKQVLMLIDACRNEPGKGDTPNRLTDNYNKGFSFDIANSDVKAFATLYATSIGERAFEFYDKETDQYRGYFSYAIEEGLKGKAANDKGEITLSRLIDYLETNVPKRVKFDKGETQIPMASYSETYRANQLILAISNKPENNYLSPAQIAWNNFRGTAKKLLKYDFVDEPSEGLSYVSLNFKFGFIDKTGIEIIPIKYHVNDGNGSFSEGLAKVRLNNKLGFIDKKGKEVIPLKYDIVWPFFEGLAAARLEGKWRLIDKIGKDITLLKYNHVNGGFSEGLLAVSLNDKWGYIDKTGREVVPLKYDWGDDFSEGLATVAMTNWNEKESGEFDPTLRFGFIDKTGKIVIPLKFLEAGRFSEGLAAVSDGRKWGYVNKTGKGVISFKYDEVSLYSESFAGIELNNKAGFIDKSGNEVIPLKYDGVRSFSDGLAPVLLNGKWGLIDKSGNEVIPLKYDWIWIETFKKEGFIGVKLNEKKGFVDIYGNEYFDF
jgi:hypothetical protein